MSAPIQIAGSGHRRQSSANTRRYVTPSLFVPGRNCYRSTKANRVALLVDGEHYFRAFAQAALLAQHSIVILAWDFDSRMRLHWEDDNSRVPATLGAFLNYLV